MIKQAKYLRDKFIRDGIAGFLMAAFFLWSSFDNDTKEKNPTTVIILFTAACAWLYFGLKIRHKLKLKMQRMTEAEIEAAIPPRGHKLNFAFSFLLVVTLIVLMFGAAKFNDYAAYFAIPLLIGYFVWLYFQVKAVNKFLDS